MVFEFSWSDYEDYHPYILDGEDKTQEEFEADCNKALKESFSEYMAVVGDYWAGLTDWTKYAVAKMEDYGYTLVKPMKFGYSGLHIPKTDRYCEWNNEQDMEEYQSDFPEFLDEIKIMIAHNDVVDERLYGD